MNDLNKTLVVCVCILGFTSALFFFQYTAQKARNADVLAQKESAYLDAKKSLRQVESQNVRTSEIQDSAKIAKDESDENFQKAADARAELERLEANAALERKELETYFTARLERETLAKNKLERELAKIKEQRNSIELELMRLTEQFEVFKSQNAENSEKIASQTNEKIGELQNRVKVLEEQNRDLTEKNKQLNEAKIRAEAIAKSIEQTLTNLFGKSQPK